MVLSTLVPFVCNKIETLRKHAKKELKALTVTNAECNPFLRFLFSNLCDLVKKAGIEDTLNS